MTTSPSTRWLAPEADPNAERELVRELRLHPLTARLLVNRGLRDPEDADRFLRPALHHLDDPFTLPDMDKAARRIAQAVTSGEKMMVYGDYDVDGVTSTALYVRTLTALGANLLYRVPHRRRDGYDIKSGMVEWAHEEGVRLIVTSDCGIQAREAVARANELGLTVIVTDHHEPGETLPEAYAVVNPHRHDSECAFKDLAGVGVAFKTMQAVVRLVKPEHEAAYVQKFLDLVACGTVADVMPLLGENRVFASHGLKMLARTRKVGLRALLDGAGIDTKRPLTAYSVGFGIGPRINAVGRLDDAALALDLLLTGDPEEARALVETLNAFNLERKAEQQRILTEALAQIQAKNLDELYVIVAASPGWNSGVVGIVAGKLAEAFHRPAIVIGVAEDGASGKGSARSILGYNLFDGIQHCKDLLGSCGGHEMAAGLSLGMDNLAAFEQKINAHAASLLTPEDRVPTLLHDAEIDAGEITVSLLEEWAQLAPFGQANPEPRFVSRGVFVCDAKRMGKDMSHLKMRVRARDESVDCVGWGFGDWADQIGGGDRVDVLYAPQINEWNGTRRLQLVVKDLKTSGEGQR